MAAFDAAPVDNDALTPEEAADVAARMEAAARGDVAFVPGAEVTAWIARHLAREKITPP